MPLPITSLSALMALVRPVARRVPDPLAIQAIRLAAIDFCERTRVWREQIDMAISAQDEVVPLEAYMAIHRIETAEYVDGAGAAHPLRAIAFNETDTADRDTAIQSTPIYLTQSSENTVSLVPFSSGTVRLWLILKPIALPQFGVSGSTTLQDVQNVVPTFIARQYAQVLADGALGRILSMPGQTWSNAALAVHHNAKFEAKLQELHDKGRRGQQRAPKRSKAQWV